ncbi:hypothetical protein GS918_28180 [Rhodococcus hoagii]|nr:hypothetical protein [Prescottella equi]
MAARNPDPFRASIDHKLPRSRGGTNDPQNLQLTHLWCNQVKSDARTSSSRRSIPICRAST